MTVAGRVILVTGATCGLGKAVVTSAAAGGATVLGVSRSSGIRADVGTPEGARSAVEAAVAQAGRVDALVHLVGGYAGGRTVADTDDALWTSMLDVNLNAAFYMTRAVLPHLIGSGWGRIVTIGARLGVEPGARAAAYSVAKAGLIALTRAIAAEVRDAGVTANAILPSIIDTPDNRAAMPSADFSKWVPSERIAALVLWLLSDEAADVNGATIPVYGRA